MGETCDFQSVKFRDQVLSMIVKFIQWFCRAREISSMSEGVPAREDFHGLVVPEASSRHLIDEHYLRVHDHEDHFSVSRPKSRSRIADSFQHLVKFFGGVLSKHMKDVHPDPLHLESAETQKHTRLNPSQILRAGDSRCSPNGFYRLLMQKDNNLVLQGKGGQVIWSSNTALNLPNCYCIMQTDGNAVIYAIQEGGHRQTAIWATNTYCPVEDASHYLEVQNDGNVVIYDEWRKPVWATNTRDTNVVAVARLTSDQVLERGAFLMSPNEGYKLVMQDDCNLVLYCTIGGDLRPLWATNTYTSEKVSCCYFIMQVDGNAVLYAGDNSPPTALWSTKTASQTAGIYYIEVQDDGNVVMYEGPSESVEKCTAVWATHTVRGGPVCPDKITSGQILSPGDSRVSLDRRYILLMQWDGDLVLYKKAEGRIWASGTACQTYRNAVRSGGTLNCYFVMTPNGNAELHVSNRLLWSTETNCPTCNGTYYVEVQNDGNVVLYDIVDRRSPRKQLWATNTAEQWRVNSPSSCK